MQAGRRAAAARGVRLGPAPYGWRTTRGQLTAVREEQAVRWLIEHLTADGYSMQAVADELVRLKIPTRAGSPTWSKYAVRSVLRSNEPVAAATG